MKSTMNQKYLGSLKSLLQIPMVKQLIFMLGIAGGVALGIVLYMSIQEPIYRPLDYQVTSQNMSSIIDTLDKAGIRYKMNETDGLIMIPAKDIQLARLKLSAAGVAKDDSFSFSFLNEQNSIGNSQFLENARYLRALEADLGKTISALQGVSSARVHIAIPQNNVFADENGKPTASVVVNMGTGLASDKDKIRAIVQIVARSVPGLDPKNVAITDQYGHYLSSALDQDAAFSGEQLNYQNNIQNYYEKRIEGLIIPMMGENKVTVRVHADIDFSQQEEAKEQYDPSQHAVRSEQTVSEEIGTGNASGAPGALSNSPPTNDSDKKAAGAGANGGSQGNSQGKSESIKNYELGKSVSYKKSSAAKIKNLSVAIVVDNEQLYDPKTKKNISKPLDKDKIAKITDLVRAAIGFSEERGDKVTVVNSIYIQDKKVEAMETSHMWDEPWFWDLIKKSIGMILGFVFLYILYRRMSNYLKTTSVAPPPQSNLLSFEDGSDTTSNAIHDMKQDKLNRLKELADREPTRVASVIKNWVGK